ncbi:MAG: archaeosortase/exosortase family protein [Pseudanabaena sp. ELA607]|jgi:cyanoexosortase A
MTGIPPQPLVKDQLLDYSNRATKLLGKVSFWLMLAVILMAALQMMALSRNDMKISSLPMTFWIAWGSILVLLWRRRHGLETLVREHLWSRWRGVEIFLATVYLTALSIREAFSPSDVIGNLFPVMALGGLLAVVVGVRQWGKFNQELGLAGVLSIPYAWLSALRENMRIWDAQNMSFWLHYLGFKVVRQGSTVAMPGGAVDVNWGCSSMGPMVTILSLVLILLALFPASRSKQIFIIVTSMVLVFMINGVRLMMLALFVHWQNRASFDYWHGDVGANIFSNLIVVVVGLWCYWRLQPKITTKKEV